eukprot:783478-Amphidinium_carterae.5
MLVQELRKALVAFLRHGEPLGRSPHGILTITAGMAHMDPEQSLPSELVRAWQHAEPSTRQHGRAEGPVKHLWSSLAVLGWKVHAPGTWETQDAVLITLLDCTPGLRRPGLFQHELRRAVLGVACRSLAADRDDYQGARMMSKPLYRSVIERLSEKSRGEYNFHLAGVGPSWKEQAERMRKDLGCPLCGARPCTWQHSLWDCKVAHPVEELALLHKCRLLKAPPCFMQRGLLEESLDCESAQLESGRQRKDFCLKFVLSMLRRKSTWLSEVQGLLEELPEVETELPARRKRTTSVPILPSAVEAARSSDLRAVVAHTWSSRVEHKQTVVRGV